MDVASHAELVRQGDAVQTLRALRRGPTSARTELQRLPPRAAGPERRARPEHGSALGRIVRVVEPAGHAAARARGPPPRALRLELPATNTAATPQAPGAVRRACRARRTPWRTWRSRTCGVRCWRCSRTWTRRTERHSIEPAPVARLEIPRCDASDPWFLAAALAQAVAVAPARAEEGLSTLMDHGRLRQAATVAETRLRTGPDDVEALRVLALIRATERRFDEARKLGEKAVAAAPQDPDARYALALACGREVQSASTLGSRAWRGRFREGSRSRARLGPDHEKATEGMIEFYQGRRGSWAATRRRRTRLADRLIQTHPRADGSRRQTWRRRTRTPCWPRPTCARRSKPP